MGKHYPDISANASTDRRSFYSEGRKPKLSEVVSGKSAECAEIALLAHEWLNRQGIPNQYFSGNVMWNKEWEFSEPHSFILIPQEHGAIIFDPSNPTSTTAGNMPSVYKIDSIEQIHAWEAARTKQNAFLVLQNEISKKDAVYGVSSGTNVDPDRHFISSAETVECERPEKFPGGQIDKRPSA